MGVEDLPRPGVGEPLSLILRIGEGRVGAGPPHAPWRLHHPVSATSRRWGGSQLLHVSQNQEAAGARSCLGERVPLDPLPTLREWGLEGERRERTPSQPLAGSVGPSSSSFPSPVSTP